MHLVSSRSPGVEVIVVADQDAVIAELGRITEARRPIFLEQGKVHGDIDHALVHKINALLEPEIGPWDTSNAAWYQELDYYGNGIRHLEFQPGRFPVGMVKGMKALLTGDHAAFGILCWAVSDLSPNDPEGVLIFSDTLVVTKGLAGMVQI